MPSPAPAVGHETNQDTCARPSLRMRISSIVLHDALVAGRAAGCFVDLWRQSRAGHRVASNAGGEVESIGTDGVKMAAGGAEDDMLELQGAEE